MRQPVVLITGAAGEIGHALIHRLSEGRKRSIITLDLKPLEGESVRRIERAFVGSIVDENLLETILAEYAVDRIYHLAALLSTRAEFTPVVAHQVNVEGTLNLLEFAQAQGRSHGRTVRFFYPSSIASYGVDKEVKDSIPPVDEASWAQPITMYGCNKLYCELLGHYYSHHYRQLDAERQSGRVDFRSLRFPGLISAQTVPSGGTSDYAPEMVHAAAQSQPYASFVRPDTRIPFMAMPDAIDAIIDLMDADRERLTRSCYNVAAFNPSAEELSKLVGQAFPSSKTTFEPDIKRQAIVDSWPAGVDDSAARNDWGYSPQYDLDTALHDYLVPALKERYAQ